MTTDPKRLIDQRVAAEFLDVSTRTLEGWRLRGGGPVFIKAGRSVRYRPCDLIDWTEAQRRISTSADTAPE
ncbi:MAG: helix-turn-helix domain-containing protein [Pseudomonadota bacterium]|nr:helix-turn-helix domain-containing protein [Pseudomonadota bacterium]